MRLIGLDIGTTGCKATVFEEDGRVLYTARREYKVSFPRPDWAEQDAERVWYLIQDALREIVAAFTEDGVCGADIGAIGLSVQGEAVIPVDASGNAMRPAILGMDTRTTAQNEWLSARLGARALFEQTGMPVHTINTLPKLAWIRDHEPDIWQKAHRFALYEDFVIRKMTGAAIVSRCLASRTQMYDMAAKTWSPGILSAIGLDHERLPAIQLSATVAGEMGRDLAYELGFATPPLVVTGGHDQACGALGVGLTNPGLAMVSTGTAEVVEVALSTPALNDVLYNGNISVYSHTLPGLFLAMTLNHSGGLLLRWFRDTFGQAEVDEAQRTGRDAYDILLEEAPDAPTALLVLPHFAGSVTPAFDTASKGAILGLTFSSTKGEIAKALLEGLTYELQLNLDLLQRAGLRIDELRAIGGGARSRVWLQLKADITGIPVAVPEVTDAACWGAAVLAGVGAGCYDDVATAANQAVRIRYRIDPDRDRAECYRELFDLYREVYPAVSTIHHRLHAL